MFEPSIQAEGSRFLRGIRRESKLAEWPSLKADQGFYRELFCAADSGFGHRHLAGWFGVGFVDLLGGLGRCLLCGLFPEI